MKNDEFAFFNQQLAAMLRDGIPLEGALQRLCAEMRQGPLRAELEKLGADLARGTPLAEAARARQLPELYQRMLEVGVLGNDLPGVLTLLADHYQRNHAIWTRLKGLMVYPTLVLVAIFLLSCFLSYTAHQLTFITLAGLGMNLNGIVDFIIVGPWIAPVVLGLLIAVVLVAVATPLVQRALRWRVPAFREASLAQVASAFSLMLKSGVPLKTAVALVIQLEKGTPAEAELKRWGQSLAEGCGKFPELAAASKVFPPLFVWMVSHSGEDLAAGFQRVSETYDARAAYRSDLILYSALPCAILILGLIVVLQILPVFMVFIRILNDLGGN